METKEFDENDALAFIRNYVPASIRDKYTDDDILLLIDTMYDFFDNGDEDEILYEDEGNGDGYNINEIVNYVKKNLRKDPDNQIDVDDVKYLVEGELEYENSLGDDL